MRDNDSYYFASVGKVVNVICHFTKYTNLAKARDVIITCLVKNGVERLIRGSRSSTYISSRM